MDMENPKIFGRNNQPLKIQVITDTHYYSRENGTEGAAYGKAESKSQKVIKDTDLVIDAAWELLLADQSADIVLLSGDTTKDGELSSHREFIEKLRELKKKGKRVYVITSTHDYQDDGFAKGFAGADEIKIPAAKREDLWEMYFEFGPNEALSCHLPSMSYVVQLCDGYRLFALNDDTNGVKGSGYSENCMNWILKQLEDAQKSDQYVIAMTHHPMLSPSPFYAIIGKNDMQRDALHTVSLFADKGLHCMLSGHTHIHNISQYQTALGNVFYDISTASLVGYPPVMRTVVFDPANENIHVETQMIEEVKGLDTGGKPFPQYMKAFFIGMISEVLWAAANDIDRLSEMTGAFSIPGEKVRRFGWLIKPPAKLLSKLTIGTVGNWTRAETGLKKEDYADIKDKKVVEFILEMVTNLYAGDAPYTPDTNEYKITVGLLNMIDSLLDCAGFRLGKILKGADSVRALVEPLLYNPGPCDDHADLKIHGINKDENVHIDSVYIHYADTVKKSKKGPLLLVCLILVLILALALLVILLPVLAAGALVGGIFSLIRRVLKKRPRASK